MSGRDDRKNRGLHLGTFVSEAGRPVVSPHRQVAELRRRAEEGDATAQNDLGAAYAGALPGLRHDENAAIKWFRKAADQGLAAALGNLGRLYLYQPDGDEERRREAVALLRRAVELGDSQAMCHLAWACRFGKGAAQNVGEAARLYRTAADLGNPAGLSALASLYAEGEGVAQDVREALRLSRLSAERGDPLGLYLTGKFYFDGSDGVLPDEQAAAEWFRRAAEAGFDAAQEMMGSLCETGRGVPKDLAEARRWYTLGADQGNAACARHLAQMCFDGQGVSRNVVKGLDLLRRAADLGDTDAVMMVAIATEYGVGTPQNDTLALAGYRRAAKNGSVIAQFALGEMYENGTGTEPDRAEADRWFGLAAAQCHEGSALALRYPHAPLDIQPKKFSLKEKNLFFNARVGIPASMREVGNMFRFGAGVPKCFEEAVRWLMPAAKAGLAEAAIDLADVCADESVNRDMSDSLETVRLLQPFAEQGRADAQLALGRLYFCWKGSAMKHPYLEAAKWLRMAAGKGDALTENLLGNVLFSIGAEGCSGKRSRYGHVGLSAVWRKPLETIVKWSQRKTREAAFREARVWYRKAAEQNFPEAYANLGDFAFEGVGGVPCDDHEALLLYERAAKLGDRLGKTNAGVMLIQGWGCEKDENRGRSLLREAVQAGSAYAEIAYRLFGPDTGRFLVGEMARMRALAEKMTKEMKSYPYIRTLRQRRQEVLRCFFYILFFVGCVCGVLWLSVRLLRGLFS